MRKSLRLTMVLVIMLAMFSGLAAAKDVITLWTFPIDGKYEAELPELLKKFVAENPDIKIEYEVLAWAEGTQKFDVAINAGNPPDIFWAEVSGKYVETGLIIPVEEWLSEEDLADYDPKTLVNFKIDDVLYGLPLYSFIYTFGGNKELLEEAGIDWVKIQEEGWTFDEFFEAAKKLTKKLPDGRTQYGFLMPGTNFELLEFFLLNSGIRQMVSPAGELLWTKEALTEGFEFIVKMMDEGVMPKEISGMSAGRRWELFNSWETAMFGRGIPYFEVQSNDRRADIEKGVITGEPIEYVSLPLPHKPGEMPVTYGGSQGYAMFRQVRYKGDEHTANVAKLLRFLTQGESAITAANLVSLPSSISGREYVADSFARLNPHNVAVFQNSIDNIHRNFQEPISVEVGAKESRIRTEVATPIYQAVISYEMTPEKAAAEFVSRAQRILDR